MSSATDDDDDAGPPAAPPEDAETTTTPSPTSGGDTAGGDEGASSAGPPTVEKLRQAGNELFKAGKPLEAVEKYADALAIEPSNHLLLSNRSLAHASAGAWTAAIEDARECVRLAPDFVKGYYRLASAQLGLGLFDEAADTVKTGLAREADNAELKKLTRLIKAKKDAARREKSSAHQSSKRRSSAAAAASRGAAGLSERQREFAEVAHRIRRTEAERADATARGQAVKRDLARTSLTRTQVYELPDETEVYRAVGKIFLQSSKQDALELLAAQHDAADERLEAIAATVDRLQRKLEAERDELEGLKGPAAALGGGAPQPQAAAS